MKAILLFYYKCDYIIINSCMDVNKAGYYPPRVIETKIKFLLTAGLTRPGCLQSNMKIWVDKAILKGCWVYTAFGLLEYPFITRSFPRLRRLQKALAVKRRRIDRVYIGAAEASGTSHLGEG